VPHPPEFDLAAACCRWPPSPERDEAVRRAADAVSDWPRFLQVVRRHRIEGLAHDGLARAGVAPAAAVADELREAATAIAAENLRYAAEARRLSRALEEAGIVVLFLKGLTLNILAYNTLGIKKSADLDLVVEPASLERAIDLMEALDYACVTPALGASREEILAFAARAKDIMWVRGGLAVEIHHGFVDSPLMLPGISVASPRQMVRIAPGVDLPTLAKDELFAYLCVHGATHAWSRLKWIADVAALLAGESEAEIARLHRRAVEMGAGRATAQALLLSAELFALPLGAGLRRELESDRAVRYLARAAVTTMLQGDAVTELDDLAFGTAAIHFSHFRLMPGWRYKAAELRRKLGTIEGEGAMAPWLAAPRWLLRRAAGRVRGG
jgi:hypothetical protein